MPSTERSAFFYHVIFTAATRETAVASHCYGSICHLIELRQAG
jgi:hypothetical protein